MNGEAMKLSEREVYLLGVLAERNDIIEVGPDKLPRGCDDTHVRSLLQVGYAIEKAYRLADGRDIRRYRITRKGIDAWRSYRFVN